MAAPTSEATVRDVLLLIHILAAAAWFGGATFHAFASARVAGSDPVVALKWAEIGSAAGKTYYMPASIVTLLAGISLVATQDAIGWGAPFVSIGFVAIIATIAVGVGFIERTAEAMVAELTSDAPDPATLASLGGRLRMLSLLDILILATAFWAMVAKPGGLG